MFFLLLKVYGNPQLKLGQFSMKNTKTLKNKLDGVS